MGIEPCCLDSWIAARMGVTALTLEGVRAYQLAAIRRVLAYAEKNAPFYAKRLGGWPVVQSLTDFTRLPVLTAETLIEAGSKLTCVEQEQICRVYTSGTTDRPKRLCFTKAELDATVDYFAAGSRQFLRAGDGALVLFDTKTENGAGALFLRALARMQVANVPFGVPPDGRTACHAINQAAPSLVLAAPETARAMLACGECAHFATLLVSGGALADRERDELRTRFGCDVFMQYGLTESAFGLGVDCRAFAGYHLRETDYYTEIVDVKGSALPPGEWGRVVITSLCCGAAPLIRYDTGDISRYLPPLCACNSPLPLLDRIRPRALSKGYRAASWLQDI